MRFLSLVSSYGLLSTFLPLVTATRLLESNTLNVLHPGNLSVSHFSAVFKPDDRSIALRLVGKTSITGFITADVVIVIYGYETGKNTVDPCKIKEMIGFCPPNAGPLDLTLSNIRVPEDVIGNIPGIGFTVPDLDASIRLTVNSKDTGEQITAAEIVLSNSKSVYQPGVGWTTAVIAGLGLVASIFVSIFRGYSGNAAHLTAYTLSLFGFMQSQAMIGMLAVPMPPIVRSWTQNFQWSMGVVHVGFLESICTWYQRATGGTPARLREELSTGMLNILKRQLPEIGRNTVQEMVKRAQPTTSTSNVTAIDVRGLTRVALNAHIEETNLFLTSVIIFGFVTVVIMLLLAIWKGIGLIASQKGRTLPIQREWNIIAKGILYRLLLLAFPPICIFCLWEFTQHDSPAEIVVAVLTFVSILGSLGWAAARIIILSNRSAGYLLSSNTSYLHKYGFFYIQYNPNSTFFIAITLAYLFIKSLFISFAQSSPNTQAIALLIIEALMLIAVCILRPWTDKKTNGFNITVAAIQFLNSIFVLFFSGIFGQPRIVSSVMGVVLFVLGAILTLILLILVLVSIIWTIFVRERNSAKPYREMMGYSSPASGSSIGSATRLTSGNVGANRELNDLAATARGENDEKRSTHLA